MLIRIFGTSHDVTDDMTVNHISLATADSQYLWLHKLSSPDPNTLDGTHAEKHRYGEGETPNQVNGS